MSNGAIKGKSIKKRKRTSATTELDVAGSGEISPPNEELESEPVVKQQKKKNLNDILHQAEETYQVDCYNNRLGGDVFRVKTPCYILKMYRMFFVCDFDFE